MSLSVGRFGGSVVVVAGAPSCRGRVRCGHLGGSSCRLPSGAPPSRPSAVPVSRLPALGVGLGSPLGDVLSMSGRSRLAPTAFTGRGTAGQLYEHVRSRARTARGSSRRPARRPGPRPRGRASRRARPRAPGARRGRRRRCRPTRRSPARRGSAAPIVVASTTGDTSTGRPVASARAWANVGLALIPPSTRDGRRSSARCRPRRPRRGRRRGGRRLPARPARRGPVSCRG